MPLLVRAHPVALAVPTLPLSHRLPPVSPLHHPIALPPLRPLPPCHHLASAHPASRPPPPVPPTPTSVPQAAPRTGQASTASLEHRHQAISPAAPTPLARRAQAQALSTELEVLPLPSTRPSDRPPRHRRRSIARPAREGTRLDHRPHRRLTVTTHPSPVTPTLQQAHRPRTASASRLTVEGARTSPPPPAPRAASFSRHLPSVKQLYPPSRTTRIGLALARAALLQPPPPSPRPFRSAATALTLAPTRHRQQASPPHHPLQVSTPSCARPSSSFRRMAGARWSPSPIAATGGRCCCECSGSSRSWREDWRATSSRDGAVTACRVMVRVSDSAFPVREQGLISPFSKLRTCSARPSFSPSAAMPTLQSANQVSAFDGYRTPRSAVGSSSGSSASPTPPTALDQEASPAPLRPLPTTSAWRSHPPPSNPPLLPPRARVAPTANSPSAKGANATERASSASCRVSAATGCPRRPT